MTKTNGIRNTRIKRRRSLIRPIDAINEIPLSDLARETVKKGREDIVNIINGVNDKKLFVVGPCSIHNIEEAKLYIDDLTGLSKEVRDKILIVARLYFEKPRTVKGWKGLINDPHLNGTYDLNLGYKEARKLSLYALEKGILTATEFVNKESPQYFGDLIAWNAIGARDIKTPFYREMSSGLSMSVGCKNSTGGNITVAVDAVESIKEEHSFPGIDEEYNPEIYDTEGNKDCHIILRGGDAGPNYTESFVRFAQKELSDRKLAPILMIDCSHDNSGKDYTKQAGVLKDGINQIVNGNKGIIGFMLESYINEGNQKIPSDLRGFDASTLKKDVSVTDSCIGWKETYEIIKEAYDRLKDR